VAEESPLCSRSGLGKLLTAPGRYRFRLAEHCNGPMVAVGPVSSSVPDCTPRRPLGDRPSARQWDSAFAIQMEGHPFAPAVEREAHGQDPEAPRRSSLAQARLARKARARVGIETEDAARRISGS
jgi:hypothetical protein